MSTIVTIPHITATSNSILTTNGWQDHVIGNNASNAGITLKDGDIYRMSTGNQVSDGVFNRLERLERMMGIMRRDSDLENVYKPLADAGNKYDQVLDTAIADIMNIAINTMKQHADDYERLTVEARVYRALTKEDTK